MSENQTPAPVQWRVEDASENVLFRGTETECRAYCAQNDLAFRTWPNWHVLVLV